MASHIQPFYLFLWLERFVRAIFFFGRCSQLIVVRSKITRFKLCNSSKEPGFKWAFTRVGALLSLKNTYTPNNYRGSSMNVTCECEIMKLMETNSQ